MAETKKTTKKTAVADASVEEAVVTAPDNKPKAPRAPRRSAKTAAPAEPADQAVAQETVPDESESVLSKGKYVFALGRRKTAIARVRLSSGKNVPSINGKTCEDYFKTFEQRECISAPLRLTGQEGSMELTAMVAGGGLNAQAEAVRLGMARALVAINPVYRKTLKKLGYLSRDPRAKERKKPGLRRARRSPQWSKR